ncbi:MAG: zinc transport system ATP-binding protein [Patescibacteria group bacterium]|nr:zinc transport system ATP-binding protein [Patescibacteria group bacterium]
MCEVILTADNVTVSRSGKEVVQGVSVSLERGHVLAIVGPNGAGKTTFMKAILELLPYRGAVTWAKDVRVGYVPQKVSIPSSFPLTVEEFFFVKK